MSGLSYGATLPVFLYTPNTTCMYVLGVCIDVHISMHMDWPVQFSFAACRTKGCCLATMLFCTGILLNL